MQENLTIARPYALAAFRFAQSASDIEAWSTMLQSLASATSHSDLLPMIKHPKVSKGQLKELLGEVIGSSLNAERENFIDALLGAERLALAPEISTLFETHKAAADGFVDVVVESAYEVSSAEQDAIAAAVRSRVGRDCNVTSELNSDLIGGAVIRVGDSVIDISLRGRLRALEQQLA
jgi:F-type H+-transporting ATPase subunit delta